jgi:hypothetical protein
MMCIVSYDCDVLHRINLYRVEEMNDEEVDT